MLYQALKNYKNSLKRGLILKNFRKNSLFNKKTLIVCIVFLFVP